jgi:hypothetical protein
MIPIISAAATSLTHRQPVSRPVANPGKTIALDKNLCPARCDRVFALPVGGQSAQNSAQNVAGQMRDAHMRQNEKAAIVNNQRESLLAPLSAPADEGITGFDFPGRSSKEQAGQVATITVPNQVAQVLACCAAVAQAVMLRQMTNKGVGLSGAWLDRDYPQRLQSPQRTLD